MIRTFIYRTTDAGFSNTLYITCGGHGLDPHVAFHDALCVLTVECDALTWARVLTETCTSRMWQLQGGSRC